MVVVIVAVVLVPEMMMMMKYFYHPWKMKRQDDVDSLCGASAILS